MIKRFICKHRVQVKWRAEGVGKYLHRMQSTRIVNEYDVWCVYLKVQNMGQVQCK